MPATRIFHGVLTADTVETVEASAVFRHARILNVNGAAPIYIRVDDIDPEPPWDDCDIIPQAVGYLVLRLPAEVEGGKSAVRLRSPGTPAYSVKFYS